METVRYVRFDLRDVQDAMGGHWNPAMKDEYTAVCEVCGEAVSQKVNECPICSTPVVWYNSRIWKQMYGSPDAYARILSVIAPEETTGEELCRLAGVPGFANQTEADRWRRVARRLGENRMLGIARHVVQKQRGRAAICYAINLAERIARGESRPKPRTMPEPSGGDKGFMV